MESTPARKARPPIPLRGGVQATALALVLLVLAILLLLPYGIGYGIERALLANGAERVRLANVDFNPFTGHLGLYGLEGEADGTRPLLLPRLDLHLAWRPLWNRRVVIEQIDLHGLRLAVDRPQTDTLRVGGILIDTTPDRSQTPPGTGWGFAIEALTLLDAELAYRDGDVDTRARIGEFRLSDLASFEPEQAATILLKGAIDDAPLTIQGMTSPFAEAPHFEGTMHLDGLDLHRYAGLAAPAIRRLQGRLGLSTRIRLNYRSDAGLKLDHDGTLSVEGMAVSMAQGEANAKRLGWKGRLALTVPVASDPLEVAADGQFALGPARWTQAAGGPRIAQHAVHWRGRLNLKTGQDHTELTTDGNLSVEAVVLEEPARNTRLSQGSATWRGTLGLSATPARTHVKAHGHLEATALGGTLDTLTIKLAGAELAESDVDLERTGDSLSVTHRGTLTAQGLELRERGDQITHGALHWKGRTALKIPRHDPLQLATEGTLGSRELEARSKARDTGLDYQALDWEGRLALTIDQGLKGLRGSGALTVKGLHTDALAERYSILAFDALQARPIEIQGPEGLAVGEIDIDRLTLGQTQERTVQDAPGEHINLFRSGRLTVKALEFSRAQGLNIASIEEHDVQSLTWRDRDGNWNVVGLIKALERVAETDGTTTPRPGPAKAPQEDHGARLPVRIGRITVSGDSQAVFIDDSLEPPFRQTLSFKRAELGELDSTRPGRLSPVKIDAIIGRDARLHLSGGIAPFAPRLTLDIEARIEGLPLPPLSSFTDPLIGYRMDSGELDAQIKLTATDGKLKGDNRLELHQLTVSRLSDRELKALGAKATLPLDTSLAMLKDRNNTIKLKIPLSGDVDELEVHPGDIITKALSRGLETGAKTYLAAALFPFGTALVVAQLAGEQALKVRLDPVAFAPGADTLDATDRAYLDKVAKLLVDRPKIHIRVCGVATEADRETLRAQAEKATEAQARAQTPAPGEDHGQAQRPRPAVEVSDQALRQLATRRAEVVDDYLLSRSGVRGSRLVDCRPRIDNKDPRAKPRAELLI